MKQKYLNLLVEQGMFKILIIMSFILIGVMLLVSALTLEQELSQLEQELINEGYEWLINYSGDDLYSNIEVYLENSNKTEIPIAVFENITLMKEYKVYLTGLGNISTDVFDLKILSQNNLGIEFDYVVDPTLTHNTSSNWTGTFVNTTRVGNNVSLNDSTWVYTGENYSLFQPTKTYGIYWNGSNWYSINDIAGSNTTLWEYDSSFAWTGKAWSITAQAVYPHPGVFWNGTRWFILDYNPEANEYLPNWTYSGNTYSLSGSGLENPMAVYFNQSGWFIVDRNGKFIYEYLSNWTYSGNRINVSHIDSTGPSGISFYDGFWWVAGYSSGKFYKFYPNWTYTGENYSKSSAQNFAGVFYLKDNYWYAVSPVSSNSVYKYYTGKYYPSGTYTSPILNMGQSYRWDNVSWNPYLNYSTITQTISSLDAGNSYVPSSVLDSNNKMHVITKNGTAFLYCNNTQESWSCVGINAGVSSSFYGKGALTIDSTNKIHFIMKNSSHSGAGTDAALYCSKTLTGSISCTPIYIRYSYTTTADYPSIVVDSNNKIHTVFGTSGQSGPTYCNNTQGAWSCQDAIEGTGNPPAYNYLVIDDEDNLYLSYQKTVQKDLRYCRRSSITNSWVCGEVESTNDVGYHSSIAIDSNKKAHIVHSDIPNNQLRYCNNSAGSWVCSQISTGYYPSISIDSLDGVHVQGNFYCKKNPGNWSCVTSVSNFVYPHLSVRNNKIYLLYLSGGGVYYPSYYESYYSLPLKFQVRSCDDGSCSGESFVGPSNTSSTYFNSTPVSLNTTLTPNNQYFQYKAFFDSDTTSSIEISSVSLGYSIPDTEYPIFTNLAINVTNNSAYGYGLNYRFNSTITSVNGSGGLEFNGINYSLSSSGTHYYASVGNLRVGNYPYYFWAYGNGTMHYYNSTPIRYYTVAKASPTGIINFNETSPITFGTNLNVTYTETNNGDGGVTYNLYRNNISISSGLSMLLGAGTYQFILNATGGENYSDNLSIDSDIFVVNKQGDSFTYLLNGATSDLTITYPQQINATLLSNKTTSLILLNGTTLTSGTNYTIGAGVWTLNYSVIGNQNYTTNETQLVLTVNQFTPTLTFLANSGTNNLSLIYPQEVNISATSNYGTVALDKDSVNYLTNNAKNVSLPAGSYIFRANITGDQNYSNVGYVYYNVTINKSSDNCNIFFNETSPLTYPQQFLVYTDCSSDFVLERNGTTISNATTNALGAGNYNFSIHRNDTQNYSNIADEEIFTISQAYQSITPLLNGLNDNLIVTYPQQINASYSGTNYTNVEISINGTSLNIGTNYTIGAGSWTINYSLRDSQNYSGTDYFLNLTVNPSSDNCNVLFNKTSPLTYPQQFLVYTDCGSDFVLERNGTTISNATTNALGAGNYNFSIHRNDTQNYSNIADEEIFTILQQSQTAIISLNETSPINFGMNINVACNGELFRNDENATTEIGTSVLLGAGTWDYSCKLYETQNISFDDDNSSLVVNRAGNPLDVLLNGVSDNLTVTYPQQVNISVSGNLTTATIDVNSTTLTSGTNYTLGANVWFVNVSSIETQNYTSNESNWYLTINKASQSITPLLNGANSNLSIVYPQQINASYSGTNYTSVEISINGTSVSIGTNYSWRAGNFVVNYSVADSQNYSGIEHFLSLNINPSSDNCNVLFNETSPLTYPQQFLVYTDCSSDFVLERNGTTISNATTNALGAGNYNFSIHRNDTQNYSNIADEEIFTISQASSLVYLYLNNSRSNITLNPNEQNLLLNGTLITGEGNVTLYVNDSVVNQSLVLNNVSYSYNFTIAGSFNITSLYIETQNYSSSAETFYVIIRNSSAPPIINLTTPINASSSTSTTTTFTYLVEEDITTNCSLILNNVIVNFNSSVNIDGASSNSFTNSTSIGSYTWNINCTDLFNNEATSQIYSFSVTSIPVSPGGGGSSGGGGGIVSSAIKFDLSKTTYETTVSLEYVEHNSVQLTNNEKTKKTFTISKSNMDGILFLDKTTLEIEAGETKDIEFTINAPDTVGIYTGKILVSSGGATKEILVVVNVKTDKSLFDIGVSIPVFSKTISPGANLKAQFNLLQAGIKEKMDVTLNYVIKDFNGEIYMQDSETIMVYDKKSFEKEFHTFDLPVGNYVLGVELIYPGGVAVASSQFKVKEGFIGLSKDQIVLAGIIIILLVTLFVIFLVIKNYKRTKVFKNIKRKGNKKR